MGERITDPRLQKLWDKGIEVYSFSKGETIHGCLYEAYNTYVLHNQNKTPNVYSNLGGKIHDVLENIQNNKATEADLLPAMQAELDDLDMLNIEFPKGKDGFDSIRQGWIDNMTHFCKTYKAPKGKFTTEEFFLYKTPKGRWYQGFIDLIRHNNDGSISIYDYKTSSMYKGSDIESHSKQLLLYALGLRQQGYNVNSVAWIFLKYATVKYMGKKTSRSKNETLIVKNIERKNIVKELKVTIETKLLQTGIDEMEIKFIMDNALTTNEIPEQISNEFKITPYVMVYPLTEENLLKAEEYFDNTIDFWETLNKDLEADFPPRQFYKTQKNGKVVEDIFYCTQLCSYKKSCKYIKEHNEKIALEKASPSTEDDDLFG